MKTDHDFRTNGKSQLLPMAFAGNAVQHVYTSALTQCTSFGGCSRSQDGTPRDSPVTLLEKRLARFLTAGLLLRP